MCARQPQESFEKKKYLKRITTVFDLFIWFLNSKFWMHASALSLFVCYFKITFARNTRTHVHSRSPTTTCRSSIKTTSSKRCRSALTSQSRVSRRPQALWFICLNAVTHSFTNWPEIPRLAVLKKQILTIRDLLVKIKRRKKDVKMSHMSTVNEKEFSALPFFTSFKFYNKHF